MNYKRKSRRWFFLLMRSRTPPISSEFQGGGGLNTPNPPLGTPLLALPPAHMSFWIFSCAMYPVYCSLYTKCQIQQYVKYMSKVRCCWLYYVLICHSFVVPITKLSDQIVCRCSLCIWLSWFELLTLSAMFRLVYPTLYLFILISNRFCLIP